MVEALPRFIRDMVLENMVALIRTTAPEVIDEVMKVELINSIEIFPYCAKCGEHAKILSTQDFCYACVEYGYSKDATGKAIPPYAKVQIDAVVRGNNLFGEDDEENDLIMMIV